jgi:monoamine oxidase
MKQQRRSFLKASAAAALGTALLSGCNRSDSKRVEGGAEFDVAIVGAGISGLVAARDLSRAGLGNIVVLEARDRVGGRSYNQDLGDGLIADAGPTWIGPGQTAIADLLRELEIGTIRNFDQGDAVIYLGGETLRVPTTASPVTDHNFVARIDVLAAPYLPTPPGRLRRQ